MSIKDIASLGKILGQFLALFADCFCGVEGQASRDRDFWQCRCVVCCRTSDVGRENVATIALKQIVSPRTLQRFLEAIKWDHDGLLRRCRQLIAASHGNSEAIDGIDETGTAKSGSYTVGVKRQYNGKRGKIENSVVSVAASFATNTFQCLIAAQMYLPKEWADDPTQLFCARVRNRLCPSEVVRDAKRLTLEQVRRAADVFLASLDLPPRIRLQRYEAERCRIQNHQIRNAAASVSHRKRCYDDYRAMGVDPDRIKSVEETPS